MSDVSDRCRTHQARRCTICDSFATQVMQGGIDQMNADLQGDPGQCPRCDALEATLAVVRDQLQKAKAERDPLKRVISNAVLTFQHRAQAFEGTPVGDTYSSAAWHLQRASNASLALMGTIAGPWGAASNLAVAEDDT